MPSAVPTHELSPGPGAAPRGRRSLILAAEILRNLRGRPGTTRAPETLDQIDAAYRDYVFYGNLSEENIAGGRVLELGAGHFGLALQFLAAGAAEVVALGSCAAEPDQALYQAMRDRAWGRPRQNIEAAVSLSGGVCTNPARLRRIERVAVEAADRVLPGRAFHLILSRGALGAVRDLDRAFLAMDRLLAPAGRMLHKIDLGDGGLFSVRGLNPLEFLTISEPVYRLLNGCGRWPNRRRIDYYRRKLRELGYFAGLLVTAIAGVDGEVLPHKPTIEAGEDYFAGTQELVRSIRPRLARPFRHLSDEDLAITGIFLVAQKPA